MADGTVLVLLFMLNILASYGAVKIYEPKVTKVVSNYYGTNETEYYTEGPVFDMDGNFYMLSAHKEGTIKGGVLKVDLKEKTVVPVVEPILGSFIGMPNGAATDQDGNIWVTDMQLGLLKVTPDGKYFPIEMTLDSTEKLQGFNDVIFDYSGTMWVTSPFGKSAPFSASVYSYLPSENKLNKLDTGYHYLNGIAIQHSQDGTPKVVVVAESVSNKLWAYDISGPGEIDVSSKRLWGSLPGPKPRWGGFDGIDFDSEGNLLVANYGASSIEVFGPNGGDVIAKIKLPLMNATNIEFKPGTKTVYVTEAYDGLSTFEWINEGTSKFKSSSVGLVSALNNLAMVYLVTLLIVLQLSDIKMY